MPTATEDKEAIRELLAEYCFRGTYLDDVAKADGRWRFRYRKIDRFIVA
jgi:hypothetical protein